MRLRRALPGLVAAGVLVLIACGDDGPGGEPSGTDASPENDAAGDRYALPDSPAEDSFVADGPTDARAEAEAAVACAGNRICAPSPPAGWSFSAFYEGAARPECGDASAPVYDVAAGLIAAPATCTSCDVGGPTTPGTCNGAMMLYAQAGCAGGATSGAIADAPACTSTSSAASLRWVVSKTDGTCAPPPEQAPVVDAPVWGSVARGCTLATAAGVCPADQTCVEKPESPFLAKACVWREGDVACPSGFGDRRLGFRSFSDTRSCSACAVAYASTCVFNAALRGGPFPSCGGATLPLAPGACVVAGPPAQVTARTFTEACPSTGGEPTGSALPEQPVTTCCTP